MATKTFDELKQLAIQIRDEKTNKQNTANRVGAAMLEAVNKLEQDYYDKTNIDEQSKNTTQSITSLDTKIDKRTTEYNVSVNNPTSGTNGGNKYDLSTAIGQVPAELRSSVNTVSFLNQAGKTEKWEFNGGSWTTGSFTQIGAGEVNKQGVYNVDANVPLSSGFYTSTTARNAVPSSVRKLGLIITYKTDSTTNITEQFIGSAVSAWTTDSNWKNVGSEGGNKILEWNTDAATTRKQVPSKERKAGMQISYKPDGEDWVNEQYIGTSFTDTEWAKDENWEKVPKQSKVLELSYKINDIIGTDSVVLFDNLELVSKQEYKLPNDISDDSLIEFELLTDNITGNLLWGNGYKNNNGTIKYRIPIARQYRDMKSFIFEFQGVEKAYAKISILGKAGIISGQDRLVYKGGYNYKVSLSNLGLKVGDKLLVKNIPNEYSQNLQRVELFKNVLALDKLIVSVTPNFESVVSIPDETEGLYISVSGDTEIYVYQISESNDLNNQVLSQPLSEYDFIAAGDSITAWNTSSDTGIEGVEKFDGWANLLAGHIGFKSYSNIAIPGASYIQSSNVGSYTYSINRGIKEGVPEQYSGILAIMGGTNDYNGTNSLGNVEETMSKTYEDLDKRNSTNNFSTICDGFRYSLETAIRRCSWKARIFVITCLPRNNRGEYTVADMNEQIKLISKEFNVPVIDMFSELNLRNGLDQFGETWKLSEVSDDGGTENVHPNAETQKMMMRFIFGKLLTYIR